LLEAPETAKCTKPQDIGAPEAPLRLRNEVI
jgi:hypothetical protein